MLLKNVRQKSNTRYRPTIGGIRRVTRFFKGVIIASFKISGKMPHLMHIFMQYINGACTKGLKRFINELGILCKLPFMSPDNLPKMSFNRFPVIAVILNLL